MVVALQVGLLELVIQDLGMVDTETALFAAHTDNFVNQVQLILSQLWVLILVDDDLRSGLVLGVVEVE